MLKPGECKPQTVLKSRHLGIYVALIEFHIEKFDDPKWATRSRNPKKNSQYND